MTEGFVIPGYIIALATAFLMGAKAVIALKSGGNGHSASLPELRQHFAAQTATLQTLTQTLSVLTERLSQLPTRVDLEAAAKENRHDARGNLREMGAGITQHIVESEARLKDLILRTNP